MKLNDIFMLTEEQIMAVLKSGHQQPLYKNPTPEELDKIDMNGVVKGIMTPSNFIGFDFNNVNIRDLPPISGYPIIIFLHRNDKVVIELMQGTTVNKDQFEKMVYSNNYLKQFQIDKVIWHNETE